MPKCEDCKHWGKITKPPKHGFMTAGGPKNSSIGCRLWSIECATGDQRPQFDPKEQS
jgi:hypothetical protein